MYSPNTAVYLLNTPLSEGDGHQLTFSSVSEQTTYFSSCAVHSFIDASSFSFQRKDYYIRIPLNIESLYNCNYVMYRNNQFTTKYFYAFITNLEYVNENVTQVYIKTDVWQTWQFDLTFKDSYIERQHPSTDYYNTLVDSVGQGDLKVIQEDNFTMGYGKYIILFNADPTTEDASNNPIYYPNISGYVMPVYMAIPETADKMGEIIQAVSNKGRADRIQACYYSPHCPAEAFNTDYINLPKGDLNIHDATITLANDVNADLLFTEKTVNITLSPTYFKEICYPYAKLEIVDRATGKAVELDLSKFDNPYAPTFRIYGSISELSEYKVVPLNYNGALYGIENALVVRPSTELPTLNNSYAKYLKDNTMSQGINAVMTGVGAIGSIATGNVLGMVSSMGNLASILSQDKVAQTQPNQVNGLKGDCIDYISYTNHIYFRVKVMDENHMSCARKFWQGYGYPIKTLATPNLTSNFTGKDYNYIKMVEPNIEGGNIPQEDMKEINTLFITGITLWHDTTSFRQY